MKKEIFLKNNFQTPPFKKNFREGTGTERGTDKKCTGYFYITPTLRIYRKVGGIK